jgi:xanthine/uracil permease
VFILRYFARLAPNRLILWSYVIWWAVMVQYYFTPDLRLWITSVGIGTIVGFALMLCTGPITLERFRHRFWESLRLFICPFLVSSFSATVAGNGFLMVFSPDWHENTAATLCIIAFLLLVLLLNRSFRPNK